MNGWVLVHSFNAFANLAIGIHHGSVINLVVFALCSAAAGLNWNSK